MKKRSIVALALAAMTVIFLYACKDDEQTSATLQVYMTDLPIDGLRAVNVDIREVWVKLSNRNDSVNIENENEGWINLETNSGVYNLLDLRNGVTVLLASRSLAPAIVKEIRFVLGSNNSVTDTLGLTYPLTIPSGEESGLKIKLDKQLNVGVQNVLIDFDAAASVVILRDGYYLRPVLKIK